MTEVTHKQYLNRDEYVKHQSSKLKGILASPERTQALIRWTHRYRKAVRDSLRGCPYTRPGSSVLCLAARTGGEVAGFIDLGCFAVGIDLYPLPGNKYVVRGDFNHIQYPDKSVDVVFTNSLDHSSDLKVTVNEARRVLKDDGCFIVEIMSDEDEWSDPWACCHWDHLDDVIAVIESCGLKLLHRRSLGGKNRLYHTQMFLVKA